MAAVRCAGTLDVPPDPALERLARVACRLLRCPAALICLVADDRQVLAAAHGLQDTAGPQTSRTLSFCQPAVASRADLVVEDAREDRRLSGHPEVAELGIVACVRPCR